VATFSISSNIKKDKEVDKTIVYINYFHNYFKRIIYNKGHYIKVLIYINPNRFAYPRSLTSL
jgi:hypothetical protein